jgi:hypothetical protein
MQFHVLQYFDDCVLDQQSRFSRSLPPMDPTIIDVFDPRQVFEREEP